MDYDNIIQFPHGSRRGGSKKRTTSYVISVSVGVGCYRHIRLPSDATLEDLSDAILCAFGFMNDHAHAFFMDNREWSDNDCYYCEFVDEDEEYRHTCDYKLNRVLQIGSKFKYVFDFGDNWSFDCKVLRETEGIPADDVEDDASDADGIMIEIVREKGEAPVQYPAWDEED